MPTKIYYAVIALTKSEVSSAIQNLKKENKNVLAEWLENNKDNYGDIAEDWRPFNNKKIVEIIDESSTFFKSETHLISHLDRDCKNIECLDTIQIFFIDLFAMHLEKYKNWAKKVDYNFRNSRKIEDTKCCFIINHMFPDEIKKQLEHTIENLWIAVLKGYQNGSLNRIASRVDDVENFKNYIKTILNDIDRPSSQAFNAGIRQFGEPRPRPNLG